jgi:outer membrane beta-barrel protein
VAPQPLVTQHDQRVLAINALLSGYVQVTPFYGKIAFFSSLFVNYDLYLSGGIGLLNYVNCAGCSAATFKNTPNDPNTQDPRIFAGLRPGGMIGVGAHIFFTEWFGLQVELRDYITKANPGGGDANADRNLTLDDEGPQNNLFFGVGVTFMLPPSAKQTR